MTAAEVFAMVKRVGIPAVYHHFEEKSGQQPPFICFYYPDRDDFMADNSNYVPITALTIELYTDRKDLNLEYTLESVLTDAEMVFTKSEVYLDTEKMYMVSYNMEVIYNGEQN